MCLARSHCCTCMHAFTRAQVSETDLKPVLARIEHVPERLVVDREGGGVSILHVDSSLEVILRVLPVYVEGFLEVVGVYDNGPITRQNNSSFKVTCILQDMTHIVFSSLGLVATKYSTWGFTTKWGTIKRDRWQCYVNVNTYLQVQGPWRSK